MNYKKYSLLILLVFCFWPTQVRATDSINISPVVQIISYYDIYGKYPMMMWWGSASVITNDWVIISNDHVVDSGNGALASAFSVCVTKEISKKPVCDYTASLINRDDKLDISILRIDPVDIYGNPVDYAKFKTIDIDYTYEPKNQDETIAIGYPWIGADTISETKGIVSWVSQYNWYNYIKTDTLIAGWNSGGAFVRNGKLIGIPTFGIWFGDTMWYALLIKEAKLFIEENKIKESQKNPITEKIDFNVYRKNIENINSSLWLKDDIFDIILLADYQVSNYIKNTTLSVELKKQKDTWVTALWIYIEKIPSLDTDKKKFYYLEQSWFYNKDYQKLLKKTISGIEFYYPVEKTDLSAWDSSWWNYYVAIIWNYKINIGLQAPLYDEKRNKEVKKEVEKLLASIKINKDNLSKIKTSFSTSEPRIDIKNFSQTIADTGRYRIYMWKNLYEYTDIYLNELVEYNGKWKTAKEIYDVQLKNTDISQKSMIKFKGLDGFINCSGVSWINSYYNYYNYYWYNGTLDENGNYVSLESCDINIFFPKNEELNRHNYLSITMKSLKNNKSANLWKIIKFLNDNLEVYISSKETNIPNILKNTNTLKFTDIVKQSNEYKNFLSLLVRYNMIENTSKFDWNTPIKWGEYLNMYTKWIYNFDTSKFDCKKTDYNCMFKNYKLLINGKETSLDSVFKSLEIDDYNDYVDSAKIYDFDKILWYKLAWVEIGEYTYDNIAEFEKDIDTEKFASEKKKIEDFFNSIYWNKKIFIYDFYSNYSTTFTAKKSLIYYPNQNKLILQDNANKQKISFSSKQSQRDKEFAVLYKEYNKISDDYKCGLKSSFIESYKCNLKREEKMKKYEKDYNSLRIKYKELNETSIWLENEYSFYPYVKYQAIEDIFNKVDFGLFDMELSKKKDTEVEENSGAQ